MSVLTGDGALGHPPRAPYDRVVCTASVQQVPYAWVSQTRSGGRILTPWANAYFDGGLLALEPLGDGSARGRIVGKAWFMWLRAQRVPRVSVGHFVYDDQHAEVSQTQVHPFEVAGDYDAQLAVGLRVPDNLSVPSQSRHSSPALQEVSAVPDMPTGALIRLYRIQRRMGTVSLATHVGITTRYLEMIEADTKTPSVPVLRRLAKVLGVRTSALVGEAPSEDHEGPVNPRLAEVERALYTYRSLALSDGGELPTPEELAAQISAARQSWWISPTKYSDVLRTLPNLIVNSERAVHESGRSREACQHASEVYQMARWVLKHLGRVDLGGMVSDRAMRYAEETEDPLLIAAATWNLGHYMLSDDMPGAAMDVAMKGSEALEPLLPDGTPELFSLYGGMQLVATLAAVRTGDQWRARELLRGPARQAAEQVGDGHNYYGTVFGPTNVGIHAVRVEYECGEITEALRLADDVDITLTPTLERKTSLLYAVAQCYDCRSNDTAVFVHLVKAERLCPEDFQHRQDVRGMVRTLVKRAKPSYTGEVREFAGRIGLLD